MRLVYPSISVTQDWFDSHGFHSLAAKQHLGESGSIRLAWTRLAWCTAAPWWVRLDSTRMDPTRLVYSSTLVSQTRFDSHGPDSLGVQQHLGESGSIRLACTLLSWCTAAPWWVRLDSTRMVYRSILVSQARVESHGPDSLGESGSSRIVWTQLAWYTTAT
jgi:hypothetical protein